MQLSQSEFVGALDDDGVRTRHVDAGLDDGRGNQHVETLVIEVAHDLFEFTFAHLAVADTDTCFRHQFGEVSGALFDGFNIVVQVVNLTATQQFTKQGFFDRAVVVLHHKSAHRQASRGWRSNDRQVTHAGHCHVQRARDGRRGQGQNIDLTAQGLELFFLANAETVLFVDDHQAEVFDLYIVLQQFVGADHDVDFAFG